ncbi:MAG: hypothetical protein KIT84_25010 [Labilithrix sp.]|nr:hypothetical protein [Labilithrix sp.]MCW5814311.1 hypothetical protein [Labilithrix sp.]
MSARTSSSRFLVVIASIFFTGAGLVAACGSDADDGATNGVDGGDGAPGTSSGDPPVNDGGLPPVNEGGVPSECEGIDPDREVDCSGKCGPVRDICTGKVRACGGCPNLEGPDGGDGGVQACDLATNTCTPPKRTCADLGAECGTAKNTCGEYLDCPDGPTKGCADGKECDPDTNKCRDCQAVTCKDLGYECGSAWLGCGEDKPSNYEDCGSCGPAADGGARVCNTQFHTCEPKCTPRPAKELCDEAKARKGLECGVISNGCGGTVNCDAVSGYGCKSGESCGVRGIANRCDPAAQPDECKALGRTCGEITSACNGKKISCGSCPSGEVCNANGVCGAPCTPKSCDDFEGFECGRFDDGCGGTLTCGTCPGGVCNNATNSCCTTNTCSTYTGKCGLDLPNGCGQNTVDCACTSGGRCTRDGGVASAPATSTTGICCSPRTVASYRSQGQCGTRLSDGCGATIDVSCLNGGTCVNSPSGQPASAPPNGTPGTCCAPTHTCSGQDAGACAAVQDSCRPPGTMVQCSGNCGGTQSCIGGACCQPATCNGNGGEGGECNVTKDANGCGDDQTCNCAGGRTCWCGDHQCGAGDGAGQCKAALTCSSAPYTGKCGTQLDNGIGQKINCNCTGGRVCSETAAGQTGTCECPAGTPFECSDVLKNGDECGSFANGCGGTVSCGCTGGKVCNTSASPKKCCTAKVCPTRAEGSECGTISNQCGGTISCGCPSGAANANFKCTSGRCTCVKDTCRGRTGPQPDLCGGTLQCGG